MKTKAKLLLAISTLSAVVLAAGVTSTFAWFTTQSLVQATSGTLTVKSPATLTIKGYDLVKGADLTQTSTTLVTGSAAELGAVSSACGETFYAPADWDVAPASRVFTEVGNSSGVPYLAENPYVGYIQYSLAVTAAKGEDGKHLKAYVTVTTDKAGTGEDSLLSWYRAAIYHVDTLKSEDDKNNGYTEDAYETVEEPSAAAATRVFANTGKSGDGYRTDTGASTRTTYTIGAGSALVSNTNTPNFAFETQKDQNVVAHFVVAVWMEGEAGANQNGAGNQSIVVTANFELI